VEGRGITEKAENKDFGDIVKITRAEACKILGVNKIKVLNIIYCPYPKGYVAGKSREN